MSVILIQIPWILMEVLRRLKWHDACEENCESRWNCNDLSIREELSK